MSGSSFNSQCRHKHIFIPDIATMTPKKPNDIGAKYTAIKIFLRPEKIKKEKHPNSAHGHKLFDLLAVERKSTKVNRRDQMYIKFRHDDYPKKNLHYVERFCDVDVSPANEEHFSQKKRI